MWAIIAAVIAVAASAGVYYQQRKMEAQAKKQAQEAKAVQISGHDSNRGLYTVYGKALIGSTTVWKKVSDKQTRMTQTGFTTFSRGTGDLINGTRDLKSNRFLYRAVSLCAGPIQSVENILIDDEGYQSSRFGQGDNRHFAASVSLGPTAGQNFSAMRTSYADFNAWGTSFTGKGVAYAIERLYLDNDKPAYQGEPSTKYLVKGRKLYDPRKDSTSSVYDATLGTSSHRFATPSTWQWSDNPVLALLDYMTNSEYGRGLALSVIDLESIADSADKCDALVDVPARLTNTTGSSYDFYDPESGQVITVPVNTNIPNYRPEQGSSSQQKRFRINIAIDPSKELLDNIQEILNVFRGNLSYANGKYRVHMADVASPVLTIGDDDIITGLKISNGDRTQRMNRATVKFINANKQHKTDQASWPSLDSNEDDGLYDTYVTEDQGEKLHKTFTIKGCTDFYQAQDTAEFLVRDSRSNLTVAGTFGSRCFGLVPGDIVSLTYDSAGYSGKYFRVMQVAIDLNSMNVNLQLKEYDSSVYTWNDARGNEPEGLTWQEEVVNASPTTPVIGTLSSATRTRADGSTALTLTVPFSNIPEQAQYVDVEWGIDGTDQYNSQVVFDTENINQVEVPIERDNQTYAVRVRYFIADSAGTLMASTFATDTITVGNLTGTKLGGIEEGATANTIYQQADEPTGGTYNDGDIWIDTDDGYRMYLRSGGAWVDRADTRIASAITSAAGAQATADGKVVTFFQDAEPAGASSSTGDLWIDTDGDNKLYRYNGTSWDSVRDAGIASAISSAATAQSTADGKIVTFYQDDEPAAASSSTGDLWFDTNGNNELYRYNGTDWVSARDAGIATALSNAASAQSTADGKIVTFYQDDEPAAASSSEGDLWIDTNDNNTLYRFNGTAWQAARDSGIASAISDAATAQATADGKVTTFYAASTATPTPEGTGDLWYQTDTQLFFRYNGSAWQEVASYNTGDLADLDTVDTDQIEDNAVDITKIADTLQSTNYNAGSAGWKLTTDGTFEAGNGTFRGALTATTLTLDGTSIAEGQLAQGVQDSLDLADTATQNDTAFAAKVAWGFDEDAQGWGASNGTVTHNSDGYLLLEASSNDPMLIRNNLSIDGGKDHIVRVRIKRVAGSSWQGTLYYGTSGHSDSENYRKTISDTTVTNQWVVLEYDMSSLSAGGTDWVDNTITRLRFDWGASSSDDFQVDWIAVGTKGAAPVREGGEIISGSVGGVTITDSKLYQGAGTHNHTNTGFYLDSSGKFSLKDKLSFDGTTLSVDGNVNVDEFVKAGSGSTAAVMSGRSADNFAFWAGADFDADGGASGANAPFRVTRAGKVIMTNFALYSTTGQKLFDSTDGLLGLPSTQVAASTGSLVSSVSDELTSGTDYATIQLSSTQTITVDFDYPLNYLFASGSSEANAYGQIATSITVTIQKSTDASTWSTFGSVTFNKTDSSSASSSQYYVQKQTVYLGSEFGGGTLYFASLQPGGAVDDGNVLNGNVSASLATGTHYLRMQVTYGGSGLAAGGIPSTTAARSITLTTTGAGFTVDSSGNVSDGVSTSATTGWVLSNFVEKTESDNVTINGTLTLGGNLVVNGTTTTINSTTLTVDDKNIVLADGAANAAAADGAGITIDGASASLTYSSSSDRFEFNKPAYAGTLYAGNVQTTGSIGNLTSGSLGQQMEKGDASVTTLRFDADRWRLYAGNNAGEIIAAYENGNIDFTTGSLLKNGTVWMDNSRNMSNLGTISAGSITSSGVFTSTNTNPHRFGRIHLRDDSLEERTSTSDSAGIVFNYYGYGGGTSYFRDVMFYNGKQSLIGRVDGSTGRLNMTGGYDVNGTNFVNSTRTNLYLNSFTSGGGNGIFFRDGFTYNCSITAEDHNGSSADGIHISGYDGVSIGTGSNSKVTKFLVSQAGNTHVYGDLLMGSTTVIENDLDFKNMGSGTYKANIAAASFSWGGASSYPTIYGSHPDRWVMITFPHIPYLQNGSRGYSGTTTGSIIRHEGDISGTTTWDAGVKSNVGTNTYSITKGTGSDWALRITSSAMRVDAKNGYDLSGNTIVDSQRRFFAYGSGTSTTPVLTMTNTAATTFNHASQAWAANMTAGQFHGHFFGKEGSTKNAGAIGYYWSSAGSNNNFVSIGHWGADHLLRVYGDGTLNINSGKLDMGGTTVIDSSRLIQNASMLTAGYLRITGNHAVSNTGNGLFMDANYTNGQYRHRWRKQDVGGGVPLYLDYAAGTANSYTTIARFGPYSGNTQVFEAYGNAKVTGTLETLNTIYARKDGAGLQEVARFSNYNTNQHALYLSVDDDNNVVQYQSSGSSAGGHRFVMGNDTWVTMYPGYTYFNGLDLSISGNNSANNANTYFRGSSTHFVLGLANGNTFYCNYGNSAGAFRLDGANFYWNSTSILDSSRNLTNIGRAEVDYVQTNSSILHRVYEPGWSSGAQTHDVIYTGWTSGTADYIALKAAGNTTTGHGVAAVTDNGFYVGTTNTTTGGPVGNSTLAPFTATHARISGSGVDVRSGGLLISGTDHVNSSGARNLRSDSTSYTNAFTAWNTLNDTTNNPSASWHYGLRVSHGDAMTYYSATIGINFFADLVYLRRMAGGTSQGWRQFAMHNQLATFSEVRSTGNVTAYYSDERLKDFHGRIDSPLEKIKALGGYYFTENEKAKELGYDNDQRQVGVNAQEVQAVLPEVVDIAPISHQEGVDEQYLTVHYDKMVPLLIEAIKEQQEQIEKLQAMLKEITNGDH